MAATSWAPSPRWCRTSQAQRDASEIRTQSFSVCPLPRFGTSRWSSAVQVADALVDGEDLGVHELRVVAVGSFSAAISSSP